MISVSKLEGAKEIQDLGNEQGGREFVKEVAAVAAETAARAAAVAAESERQASVALPRARLWIAKFEARQKRERRRRAAAKRIRKRGRRKSSK